MSAELGYPPRLRVRRRGDFERAYAEGRKRAGRGLVVFARPNGLEETRLGVTATRRFGNAVQRNRARRVVREAFRHIRAELPGGYDLVFVVRSGLATMTVSEVGETMVGLVDTALAGAAE